MVGTGYAPPAQTNEKQFKLGLPLRQQMGCRSRPPRGLFNTDSGEFNGPGENHFF
jgi:hypothetical protein